MLAALIETSIHPKKNKSFRAQSKPNKDGNQNNNNVKTRGVSIEDYGKGK